jgi:hypothetical protein
LKAEGGQGQGTDQVHGKPEGTPGRGPIDAPPKDLPVRRGPPEPKVKPERTKPVAPPRVQKEQPPKPEQAETEMAGPKLK